MNKSVVLIAGIIGVLLIVIAVMYFVLPAKSLQSFLPGYSADLMRHRYKHGIGTLLLGLGCFAFAWFQSGKKSTQQK